MYEDFICVPFSLFLITLRQLMIYMNTVSLKKWVSFFFGILCAIMIADSLSTLIVTAAGLSGWVQFLAGFILYAGLFFGILYSIEKIFRIEFFGFWRE
jgi:hypothetical protein